MGKNNDRDLSPDDIYDEMEVLEPYTAGELAPKYDAPKQRIRTLLERLSDLGKIRKKEPEPKRAIWIREAPIHECDECGYKYEVKFLHPVLSSVQFCPRCGNQL
jgi:hypothetical protein